jgi:hypothetical protein
MGKSTDFNILTAIFIAVGLILVSVGIFVRNVLELRAEQRAAQNQRATTPGTLTTKAKQTSKRNKAWIAFSIAIVALGTLLLALFLTSFARNNRARALTNEEIQAQVVAGFEAGMADAGFSFDYEFVVTDDHCLFAFVAPPGSLHDLASNWNSPAMKRNWQLLVTGAAQQSHDTYEEFKEMGIERDFIFAILSDADRDSYLLVCTNGIVTYNIMDSWG